MKKLFLTIIAVAFTATIYSQTFTVTITSPNPHYVPMDSCTTLTSNFSINNQSNNIITLRLIRINVNLPVGWISAMCDEHNCYTYSVDTTPWQTYSPAGEAA